MYSDPACVSARRILLFWGAKCNNWAGWLVGKPAVWYAANVWKGGESVDIFLLVLLALTAAVQLYVLTRLPAPALPGATGTLRRQPGAAVTAVVVALVVLLLQGLCAVWTLQGGWQLALILWAGSLLFLLMGAPLALDGVRFGPEGFAMRDALGRARTYRWTDILAAERLIIPHRGRGFDMEITAVYLPDRTLTLRRTLEGTELPFLAMLKEKRPDLPDRNPDGRHVYSAGASLAVSSVMGLFLLALALAGMEEPARYGWLWLPVALWTVYFGLMTAVAVWPGRFSPGMREKLLGPEPRRKE